MPKKTHSKFVISADPYPAVDMTQSQIMYPKTDEQNLSASSDYDADQDWELFFDSIVKSDSPDLGLQFSNLCEFENGIIPFEYPDLYEFHEPEDPEVDYDHGIQPDIVYHSLPIDKLLSDMVDVDSKSTKTEDENAYSEFIENDWNIGVLRKEHSPEFQSEAGLDFGDENQGQVDDDEGDIWTKEE